MDSNALFGLGISLGVIGGLVFLWIIFRGIETFKEKFDRKFFITGTAWGLFLGGVLFISSIFQFENGGLAGLLTFKAGYITSSGFSPSPAASWLFYWGLIILLITWITNIRKSSFWWGTFQNIVQGVVVLALSVIIAIGALLWAEKTKKR